MRIRTYLLVILGCFSFLAGVYFSTNKAFADLACGAGAYCAGTNRYLKVDHCTPSANGLYCLNSGTNSVNMSCSTGGGPGSCVGAAPGKNGCGDIDPVGGGDCYCDDGVTACTGDGSPCTNEAPPYGAGTCTCFGGNPTCPDPDQGTTLGCCVAGGSSATNTPVPTSPPGSLCGNGVVNAGETCSNCSQDVGACQPTPIPPPGATSPPTCGNGSVNAGETCSNCPADVGTCPNPTPPGGCDPVCTGELCGQVDGCGSFCSDRDDRAPAAPTQNSPANGALVTAYDDTENGNPVKAVDLVFTTQPDTNYNAYYTYIDVYPVGASCAHPLAKCNVVVSSGAGKNQQLTYPFTVPEADYGDEAEFQWHVWHGNATCNEVDGTPGAWRTFIMADTISGSVRRDDGIAGLSGGVCTSPLTPVAYTPQGPETVVATSGGNDYTTSLNPDGTWSIQVPVSNAATSSVTFAANGGSPTACGCPSGCSYNGVNSPATGLVFYYQPQDIRDNWWQTIAGSVYAGQTNGTAIESLVPVDTCIGGICLPYMSIRNANDDTNSSGVAFSGGGGIDTSNANGYQSGNIDEDARNLQAVGTSTDTLVENYSYFYRLYSMGISPANDVTATPTKPTVVPSNGRGYYRNGNMTINSAWNVGGGESIVVFVNGNLTINNSITVANGGFLAFIVSGNVTVTPTVCQSNPASVVATVQSVIVADGSMTVQSTGGGDCKFVAEGIFTAWNGINLERDFRDGGSGDFLNAQYPAEVFRYRPDFVVNIPVRMTRPLYQWQEVAP